MIYDDLSRFLEAQESIYDSVMAELRNGRKRTHWMWFIFPQIDGLGRSSMARRYAIDNLEEARRFLAHPVLGTRLRECTQAVLDIDGRSISDIFGFPDDLKFASCMTLFAKAAGKDSVFQRALEKYCDGIHDIRTLDLL